MNIAHTSFLGKNLSNLLILSILRYKGRMNAYEILNMITEESGKKMQLKAGTLYPQIENLFKDKFVRKEFEISISKSSGRSREVAYYEISEEGKKIQEKLVKEWNLASDFIRKVIEGVNHGK